MEKLSSLQGTFYSFKRIFHKISSKVFGVIKSSTPKTDSLGGESKFPHNAIKNPADLDKMLATVFSLFRNIVSSSGILQAIQYFQWQASSFLRFCSELPEWKRHDFFKIFIKHYQKFYTETEELLSQMAPLENIDDILQRSYPYSSVKYLDELRENFLQTEIKNLSQLPHQTENQLEKIQSLQHEIQKLPTQNIHNVSSYEKESNLFFDFKTQTWYSYDKKIKNGPQKTLILYCGESDFFSVPQGVEVIGAEAFQDNTTLQCIHFPSNLKEIGNSAFYGCSKLFYAQLPASLENLDDRCFFACPKLITAVIPKSIKRIGETIFSEGDRDFSEKYAVFFEIEKGSDITQNYEYYQFKQGLPNNTLVHVFSS